MPIKKVKLQTILIPINKKRSGELWMIKNKYKLTFYGKGPDKTTHFYRYRQKTPKKGSKYYTVTNNKGFQLVYMY